MIPVYAPPKRGRRKQDSYVYYTPVFYGNSVWFAGGSGTKAVIGTLNTTELPPISKIEIVRPTPYTSSKVGYFKALTVDSSGVLGTALYSFSQEFITFDTATKAFQTNTFTSLQGTTTTIKPEAALTSENTPVWQATPDWVYYLGTDNTATGIVVGQQTQSGTYLNTLHTIARAIYACQSPYTFFTSMIGVDGTHLVSQTSPVNMNGVILTGVSEVTYWDGTYLWGFLNTSYYTEETDLLPTMAGTLVKMSETGAILETRLLTDFIQGISVGNIGQTFLNVFCLENTSGTLVSEAQSVIYQIRKTTGLPIVRKLTEGLNHPNGVKLASLFRGCEDASFYSYITGGKYVFRVPPAIQPPTPYFFLAHFDSTLTNVGNAGGTPALHGSQSPSYLPAVFEGGLRIGAEYQCILWEVSSLTLASIGGGSFTMRYRFKTSAFPITIMQDTSINHALSVSATGTLVVAHSRIDTGVPILADAFNAISIEVSNAYRVYLNGQKVFESSTEALFSPASVVFSPAYSNAPAGSYFILDELAIFYGSVMANGANSYIVETQPYSAV